MADIAIQIVKKTEFQGIDEEFSNVYTFNVDAFSGGYESDEQVIDRLLELERKICVDAVKFVKATSYSIGGLQATNVMRVIRDFPLGTSGQAIGNGGQLYRECALMFEFDLPRSTVLRRRRIGRKWMHVGGLYNAGAPFADTVPAGASPLPQAVMDWYKANYATPLVEGTFFGGAPWPGGWVFGSGGDPFTNPQVHSYVEHRQFHR